MVTQSHNRALVAPEGGARVQRCPIVAPPGAGPKVGNDLENVIKSPWVWSPVSDKAKRLKNCNMVTRCHSKALGAHE